MTYEEASAKWVKSKFGVSGEVTDVRFDQRMQAAGGCPTCGPEYYTYTQVDFYLDYAFQSREIFLDLGDLIKELVELSE